MSPMPLWYVPSPEPYRPHPATWRQPLHLHLAPLWREVAKALGSLEGRVLDVGCGARPYQSLLGPRVTGYVALDRPGTPGVDVEGTAEALPFPDASFDAAVSMQVLEHVEDPARCLAEMARVVRPGGVVVFTVPGVWPAHEVPRDYWRFTRYGLAAIVARAGLARATLVPLGGFWSALGQMANLALAKRPAGRALVPLVNLAARALDPGAREELVLNWLVRAERAP